MRALSVTPPGMFMKNARMTTGWNAVTAPGGISDQWLPISPGELTTGYDGIIPGTNRNVSGTRDGSGRCGSDPGRDRP